MGRYFTQLCLFVCLSICFSLCFYVLLSVCMSVCVCVASGADGSVFQSAGCVGWGTQNVVAYSLPTSWYNRLAQGKGFTLHSAAALTQTVAHPPGVTCGMLNFLGRLLDWVNLINWSVICTFVVPSPKRFCGWSWFKWSLVCRQRSISATPRYAMWLNPTSRSRDLST